MNAEKFYLSYKYALCYLGVSWGDKADAAVRLVDGEVRMEYCGREASFRVTKAKKPSTKVSKKLGKKSK